MIGRPEIVQRSLEWGLREDVVEKDYVLGWVLWGIGSDPVLGNGWVFKGGTCLKKCYVETYRFSEDLDFTVLPGAPATEGEVAAALGPMLARIQEASGIDFGVRDLRPAVIVLGAVRVEVEEDSDLVVIDHALDAQVGAVAVDQVAEQHGNVGLAPQLNRRRTSASRSSSAKGFIRISTPGI